MHLIKLHVSHMHHNLNQHGHTFKKMISNTVFLYSFFSTQNSSWSYWRTQRGPCTRCLWGLTASLTCRTRRSSRTYSPSWSAITQGGTLTWRKCLMTSGRGCWSACSHCSTPSTSSLRTIWSVSASTPRSSSPLETCPGSSRLRLPGHSSLHAHLSKGCPSAGRWPRECQR